MIKQEVFLASRSPRRLEILQNIGWTVHVLPVDVDETLLENETAQDYVLRLAEMKNLAAQKLPEYRSNLPLISADTAVILNQHILGKPKDADDAVRMLKLLSSQRHQVVTGVYVSYRGNESMTTSLSEVVFTPISDAEIKEYVAGGEPLDKAGAYGIQSFGGTFVTHVSGSYSGIVGLPAYETVQLLRAVMEDVD